MKRILIFALVLLGVFVLVRFVDRTSPSKESKVIELGEKKISIEIDTSRSYRKEEAPGRKRIVFLKYERHFDVINFFIPQTKPILEFKKDFNRVETLSDGRKLSSFVEIAEGGSGGKEATLFVKFEDGESTLLITCHRQREDELKPTWCLQYLRSLRFIN